MAEKDADMAQQQFEQMSTAMIKRIDEMSSRINELEDHIADISARAGIEIPPELKIPSEKQGAVQEQKQ